MERIARQRRTQQSELGDKCEIEDCKAEADTAAQHCETNVKDCKAEADTAAQSWETNVKDCKAEADTAVQSWETRETNDNVKDCKRHAAQSWETNVILQGRAAGRQMKTRRTQ